MATRPTQGVITGCRVLALMAESPGQPRTVASLARAAEGEVTPDQIEGALLALAEAGAVRRVQLDQGPCYYLLGTLHLRLAAAELRALVEQAQGGVRLLGQLGDVASVLLTLLGRRP